MRIRLRKEVSGADAFCQHGSTAGFYCTGRRDRTGSGSEY